MLNLYDYNNLVFWTEAECRLRRMFEEFFTTSLFAALKESNAAFEFLQVEAPLLTPLALVNANYTDRDMFVTGDLVLRPETTMGSYAYARHLMNPHNPRKVRLPFVVWQHAKSFRREQDQPTRHMRLKEFHQMEFQILFAHNTKNDYSQRVVPAVCDMIASMIGTCRVEPSDRLPDYAEWTQDVLCERNGMEVCSMSLRKDFPEARNLEVAIGTDRCVYNFQTRSEGATAEGDSAA